MRDSDADRRNVAHGGGDLSSLGSQPPSVVLLGCRNPPDLTERIACGKHPRVEYMELTQRYGAPLVDFDEMGISRSWAVRLATRRLGLYWGAAFLARVNGGRWLSAIAMGEDVGLRAALVQLATGGRLRLAILTHGSFLGSRKGILAYRIAGKNARVRFLCLSDAVRRGLVERCRVSAEQVFNVGFGVDTQFFQPSRVHVARQIASAGTANRDYRTLVRAVEGMDVCLKIAADSAWHRQRTDISDAELPENVEARSYGDYVGLRRLYAESAFVVLPLYEAAHACGYAVIAEAMAMGKPVITTRITGHSEYIVEGETGFYVPQGDAWALRERISYLLEHPERTDAMGRNARELIQKRFTLEAYAGRIARAACLDTGPRRGRLDKQSRSATT